MANRAERIPLAFGAREPRGPNVAKLTEQRITAALDDPAGPNKQILWDTKVTGLGVRLVAAARVPGLEGKSAVLFYRSGGRQRLVSLGPLTPNWLNRTTLRLDLEAVRTKAQSLLVGLKQDGTDPARARTQERERKGLTGDTIRTLWPQYVADRMRLKAHRSPRQRYRAEENFRVRGQGLLAEFGNATPAQVSRDIVKAWFLGITEKSGPYQANRALQALKAFYFWLHKSGTLAETIPNPARLIELNPEAARQRFLSDEELRALLKAIDAEPDAAVHVYFRMILETGARKSELADARWPDVDLKRKTLTLRQTKAGHDVTLALSDSACALLEKLPRVPGSPYLFPGADPRKSRNRLQRDWNRIRDRAGLADVRVHDLRRTHGALLVRAGVSLRLVAERLGHKDLTTTQKHYSPLETEAQRGLADHIASVLAKATKPTRKARTRAIHRESATK